MRADSPPRWRWASSAMGPVIPVVPEPDNVVVVANTQVIQAGGQGSPGLRLQRCGHLALLPEAERHQENAAIAVSLNLILTGIQHHTNTLDPFPECCRHSLQKVRVEGIDAAMPRPPGGRKGDQGVSRRAVRRHRHVLSVRSRGEGLAQAAQDPQRLGIRDRR